MWQRAEDIQGPRKGPCREVPAARMTGCFPKGLRGWNREDFQAFLQRTGNPKMSSPQTSKSSTPPAEL